MEEGSREEDREDWRLSNSPGHPSPTCQVHRPHQQPIPHPPTGKELRHNSDFPQMRAWMGKEPGVGLGNETISVFTTEPLPKELVSCPFLPLLHTSNQGERKGTEAAEGRSNPSPDPRCLINRGGRRRGRGERGAGGLVIIHHSSKSASVLSAAPSVPVLLQDLLTPEVRCLPVQIQSLSQVLKWALHLQSGLVEG